MNNPISINNFSKDKYRVRVRHFRNKEQCELAGFHGSKWATIVAVYDSESPIILAEGVSRCRKNDTPDRRRGLNIALHRAAKKLIHAGFKL